MTLYTIQPVISEDKASLAFIEELNGKNYYFEGKKQSNWRPFKLSWNLDYQTLENLSRQDFSLIIGAGVNIVLTEKAKTILEPLFKNDAEYLPVEVENESNYYYLLNVLNVVDALALDQCEFRIRHNGEMGAIKKAIFDESKSPDNRIFITPYQTTKAMFKGERLKDICKEHNLTGLEFKEVPCRN